MIAPEQTETKVKCFHCGDFCPDTSISEGDKFFCCNGCKTVYQVLNENNLTNYYNISESPGPAQKGSSNSCFEYLDDPGIRKKLIDFEDEKLTAVTLYIPQMHCSSCIWLLENLYKLNAGVVSSHVNFLRKELSVKFLNDKLTLKALVTLITAIGYEPVINLDAVESKTERPVKNSLYLKLGVAAFCFGNIMLLSFPEYLSIDVRETFYIKVFSYLNLLLSLPVFFYSSSDYFISAYKGLKKKIVNLDVPLSLGIIVLFGRTVFEILTGTGSGYADSLSGLLFFLLLGRLFQNKTYDSLNFERTYKSYFPLAVLKKTENKEVSVPISSLKTGDRIIIRNNEIIPADSILFNGEGRIDYSFVTGEATPAAKVSGELVYAGGRQLGSAIELEVIKEVSQSYLTQLWNNDTFSKPHNMEGSFTQFSNTVSKYFTWAILLVASAAAILWFPDYHIAMGVFTSVLIVACPCALALSVPFTLGNALRILGRNKFYVKNTLALEELAKINHIVFDKTGTITETGISKVSFIGKPLSDFHTDMVKSITRSSTHPLSKAIYDSITKAQLLDITSFTESAGKGIEGIIYGNSIKLGSVKDKKDVNKSTKVQLEINNEILGYYEFSNAYRQEAYNVISLLNRNYKLALLSGDNEGEKENLLKLFGNKSDLHFRQSPEDKLSFVKKIKSGGSKVLMVGDGLNDAGALSQSNVGIAVTEDISSFSPACDVIMEASVFNRLPDFIKLAVSAKNIIRWSFIISLSYNLAGLSFAVEGMLSPIVAAILMPLSSVSMVLYTTAAVNLAAKRRRL